MGWLIVALSFGMAAYALTGLVKQGADLPDDVFTAIGLAMTLTVISILALGRKRPSTREILRSG